LRFSGQLQDVRLRIAHGELVYVIGTVGSGKSNLLAAILSEMVPVVPSSSSSSSASPAAATGATAGSTAATTGAAVDGCCAFLDQQPWILNMRYERRRFCAVFTFNNVHFTKTGSGQT